MFLIELAVLLAPLTASAPSEIGCNPAGELCCNAASELYGNIASELFRDISFDAALTAADKEEKVVMVDFFTTWCGPCKKLDATTWIDSGVIAWADTNAVAVKIDAEKELDLAKRYGVNAYPTIVLLDTDGREIDRLVGYRDAATFLGEAAQALQGMDVVSRALRKLAGHENEPVARQKYADVLAKAGRFDEALEQYLWCWDHGRETPGYKGKRITFLVNSMQRLVARAPASKKELEDRRDAAEERLLANPKDGDSTADFVALDRALADTQRTLATCARLQHAGPLDPKVRAAFEHELTPVLVADQRYAEALELIGDPKAQVDASLKRFTDFKALAESKESVRPEMARAVPVLRNETLADCARVYEACLGAGRKDEAARLAVTLTAFAPDGASCAKLVQCAARAGADGVAHDLARNVLANLSDAEQKPVRDALAEIDAANAGKSK